MTNFLGSLFMLAVLPCFGQGEFHASPWQVWESPEGRFEVWAPGPFSLKTDTFETQIGKIAYHTYFLENDYKTSENVFYMASYCDYPAETIHSDSLDMLTEFFDNTVDAAVFSIAGKLMYQDSIQFQGFPGRFWRVHYLNDQAVVKTKAFLVKNRYYALQTIMLKDKSLNSSTDRFFDSFRLKP